MGRLSFWSGRRVLVTGATGMVGSWLVKDLLAGGARVAALVLDSDPQSELLRSGDLERLSVFNGSLEDYGCIERALTTHETDTVFHLGAQTLVGSALRAPLATFETNIRGAYHVLEACRRLKVPRLVVASSDKAYGEGRPRPYTEDMALEGRHPYDVSKSCADLLAQAYHVSYGLPVAVARCGNIYGGGDLNWSRIVPGTVRAFLRGERPVLRSDGKFVRDYLYVKDAAGAYMRLAERLSRKDVRGQAFNFSAEQPMTVLSLVARVSRLMGCAHLKPRIEATAKAEIRTQRLSAAKARKTLGWRPRYSLEAGLDETIAWYREHLS